jgi:hypothetical protein
MRFHVDHSLPVAIWVFGSNLAGRHGKGAAKVAREKFGAISGQGVGHHGDSYGIPTKDENLNVLSLEEIKRYVEEFIDFAKRNPGADFFVTAIGCGEAGYQPAQIAPMFKDAPDTCSFPDTWKPHLTGEQE